MLAQCSGAVTIQDLNITGCTAASAILVPFLGMAPSVPKLVLVQRVHFEGNDATGSPPPDGFLDDVSSIAAGGAIRADQNTAVTVLNSTFTNNTAEQGGAIYSSGDLVVQNSRFTRSIASMGGAIQSNGQKSALDLVPPQLVVPQGPITVLRVVNCVFLQNVALSEQIAYAPLTTEGLDIESFQFFTFDFPGLSGGAILASDTRTVEIVASVFEGNSASAGGALHFSLNLHLFTIPQSRSLTYSIQGSNFTGNKANIANPRINQGGAVFLSAPGGPATFDFINCCFTQNEANFGGALHSITDDNALMNVENCKFEGNKAATAGQIFLILPFVCSLSSSQWSVPSLACSLFLPYFLVAHKQYRPLLVSRIVVASLYCCPVNSTSWTISPQNRHLC